MAKQSMKYILGVSLWGFLLCLPMSVVHAEFPPCECPDVQCLSGCEDQLSIKFYTEKCGKNGQRVRSCAKPSCKALDPYPGHCPVAKKGDAKRTVASVKDDKPKDVLVERNLAGEISQLEGKAWIKDPNGARSSAKVGASVYELDTLITDKKGRLEMKFVNGNVMSLTPGSNLKIQTLKPHPINTKAKTTVLKLLKGKVRSKVLKKFKGADAGEYFKVQTKSAVAGVRGTDFMVSYEKGHKEITKVQTLTGEVELGSPNREQKITIGKTQYASYVAEPTNSDIEEFVARGHLTPVYKLSKAEVQKIAMETEFGRKRPHRTAKRNSKMLCRAPAALLNQCSWTCENNPKGATRCRTDLPDVKCVRRRCNANGDWKSETRLPASFYDMCQPRQIRVDDCDY